MPIRVSCTRCWDADHTIVFCLANSRHTYSSRYLVDLFVPILQFRTRSSSMCVCVSHIFLLNSTVPIALIPAHIIHFSYSQTTYRSPTAHGCERVCVCAVYFSAAVRLYTVAAACLCFSVGQNTVLQSEPLLSAKCTLGGTKHEKNNNKTNHIIIILLCNVLARTQTQPAHTTHTFIQRGTIDIHDVLHECASDRDVSSSRRTTHTHAHTHALTHVACWHSLATFWCVRRPTN